MLALMLAKRLRIDMDRTTKDFLIGIGIAIIYIASAVMLNHDFEECRKQEVNTQECRKQEVNCKKE